MIHNIKISLKYEKIKFNVTAFTSYRNRFIIWSVMCAAKIKFTTLITTAIQYTDLELDLYRPKSSEK